jgi:CRP/FNR family transcriptional regulator, cyclic AMP receptor protein
MTTEVKLWYLHHHPLFSMLNEKELKELLVFIGFINASKNQIINLARDEVRRIYFLKKGRVKIINLREDNREMVVDVIHQEDVFGENALNYKSEINKKYAKVISDKAVIGVIKLEDFEKILRKNPSISLGYAKKLTDKILKLQNRYSDLIYKNVKTRLIDFLNDPSFTKEHADPDLIKSNYNLTHQDISDMIGCTRQTVTSMLKEIKTKLCHTF